MVHRHRLLSNPLTSISVRALLLLRRIRWAAARVARFSSTASSICCNFGFRQDSLPELRRVALIRLSPALSIHSRAARIAVELDSTQCPVVNAIPGNQHLLNLIGILGPSKHSISAYVIGFPKSAYAGSQRRRWFPSILRILIPFSLPAGGRRPVLVGIVLHRAFWRNASDHYQLSLQSVPAAVLEIALRLR